MPKRVTKYKFIRSPPKGSMRRRSPESAPRLYEWLISNGYVEPVSMPVANSKAKGKQAQRRRTTTRRRR